jgi:NSS family neurotransmitter:Na+ symporter
MAESPLLEEQRENWGSRTGFVLAAIGSAVGLGNLWGFPYKLYSHGGGAFLIPYILAMVLIGVPLLIAEFSLGHLTQRATPDAFGRANRRFAFVGWWQIILSFVIITYYAVILAYCVSFLAYSVEGIFTGKLPWAGKGMEGVRKANTFFFGEYLDWNKGFWLGRLQSHITLALIITWAAMYLCIFRGIRLVGKVVMWTVPLPWLMLLILTIRGLTLEGSMQGLEYYLEPNWGKLANPATWRWAFAQMFFSMSLAFGIMITYASFLHRKSDLNNNAMITGLADMGTSFVAGLAVFATLGGMAFATRMAGAGVPVEAVAEKGPGLAFVAFPYALAQLPHAAWFSLVFFASLLLLGIDSAFSITECVLASIVDKTGWSRDRTLIGITVAGLLIGLLFCTQAGLTWLDTFDTFINGTWGITLTALLECFVLGWLFRLSRLRDHANERSDWKVGRWWMWLIRLVIPVVLGAIFSWSLFDGLKDHRGYVYTYEADPVEVRVPPVGELPERPVLEVAFVAQFSGTPEHTFELDEQKTAKDPKLLENWRLGDREDARAPDETLKATDAAGKKLTLLARGLTPDTAYTARYRWTPRPQKDPKTGLSIPVPQDRQGKWQEIAKVRTNSRKKGLNVGNFAGLCLMAAAPILAIVISALRFRRVRHEQVELPYADATPRGKGPGVVAMLMACAALAAMVVAFLDMLEVSHDIRAGVRPGDAVACVAGMPRIAVYLVLGGAGAVVALLLGGLTVALHEKEQVKAAIPSRLGAALGVVGVGLAAGLALGYAMIAVHFPDEPIQYDNELSGWSYVILAVMLALIVVGLGWCFYRALRATEAGEAEQTPQTDD